MKSKNNIRLYEIDYLRTIACLSVVLLHSIKHEIGFGLTGEGLDTITFFLLALTGLLAFGTPTFIVISEILLSYSYPNKLPSNFYIKRFKLVFIPFVFFALFYAILSWYKNPVAIPINFLYNVLGNYHGWFVLVIFQFYVLHQLFTKYFYKYSAPKVLIVTFVINVIYLGFFNFYEPTTNNTLTIYFVNRGFWIPFSGWVFYFSVAYYLGSNYAKVIKVLKKHSLWVYLLIPVSISVVLLFNNIIPEAKFGSKRFDMIFLTFNVIAVVLLLSNKINKLPKFIEVISRYSFGIYLLHWFFLVVQYKIFDFTGLDLAYFNIVLYFITGLIGSIVTSYIINQFSFGKYIVGNSRRKKHIKSKRNLYYKKAL